MIKLITAAILIFTVNFAVLADKQTPMEICAIIAGQSYNIMTFRQANGDLVELMSLSDSEAFAIVVKKAYARPLYQVQKNKQQEIQEFKNEMFIWCMEQL